MRRRPSHEPTTTRAAGAATTPGTGQRARRRTSTRPALALGLTSAAFDALHHEAEHRVEYRDLFGRRADTDGSLQRWATDSGLELRGLRAVGHERGRRSAKTLFALRDGLTIETVAIRRRDGHTACLSSQAGCAFGCRFCASGQAGLARHLLAGEIVEQVVRLGPTVNRIVFMGIGEPLHNLTEVLEAIRILRDRRGMRFPTRGITISTIGIPRALDRLREEHLAINLTVSLHATTNEQRARLIPGSRKHDVADVVARSDAWAQRHRRDVTYAYLLMPSVNDGLADARRLARMLKGRRARVNLMRWNPVAGVRLGRTPDASLRRFRDVLGRAGVSASVRDTQGRDVSAACGQLRLRDLRGLPIERDDAAPRARTDASLPISKPAPR